MTDDEKRKGRKLEPDDFEIIEGTETYVKITNPKIVEQFRALKKSERGKTGTKSYGDPNIYH